MLWALCTLFVSYLGRLFTHRSSLAHTGSSLEHRSLYAADSLISQPFSSNRPFLVHPFEGAGSGELWWSCGVFVTILWIVLRFLRLRCVLLACSVPPHRLVPLLCPSYPSALALGHSIRFVLYRTSFPIVITPLPLRFFEFPLRSYV